MVTPSLRLGRNATPAERTKAFVAKARSIHGKRYDYSKARYSGMDTLLTVVCRRHGEFRCTPANHLRSDSPSICPTCRTELKDEERRASALLKGWEFIARAKKIHGVEYDYSHVEYVNVDTPVKVVCRAHGAFFPTPWNHAGGHRSPLSGCPKCGDERSGKMLRERHKALFVQRAKRVHKNAYDYSKSVYTDARSKLTIVCPKHGPFRQEAFSHLRGVGCPKCGLAVESQHVVHREVERLDRGFEFKS